MRHRTVLLLAVSAALALLAGCGTPAAPTGGPDGGSVERLTVEVLGTTPHDPAAFTQGLELSADGTTLWEGTGLRGRSQLRELDPATGAVRRAVGLPADQFGEGVTVTPSGIWQLTWTDGVAYERDPATLDVRRTVALEREGWGVCHTGTELVTSDGSATLVVRDPESFAPRREVAVTADGGPVEQLNELECVPGPDGTVVWANVWQTDEIVRIDLASGAVTGIVDAAALRPAATRGDPDAVLNGIAAVPGRPGEFLLTGKRWPTTFAVRVVPAP